MKTKTTILSLVTIALFSVVSCKKDNSIAERISAKKEITRTWVVEEANTTFYDNPSVCNKMYQFENSTFKFNDNGKYEFLHSFTEDGIKVEIVETGDWNFFNKKTQIETKGIEKVAMLDSSNNPFIEENSKNYFWKITKLEDDELWITSFEISNAKEEFKLKPKK